MKKKILLIFVSLLITSSIIISGVLFTSNKKEEKRIYLKASEVILQVKSLSSNKLIIEEKSELQIQREIEDLNNSIKETSEVVNIKDLKILKEKALTENNILKNITQYWIPPLNYKKGSGCSIIIYNNKNKIKYKIYDCSGDAIFKRSIELSILKNIKEKKLNSINAYSYEKRLKLLFLPI
jgi:hypothetical protein